MKWLPWLLLALGLTQMAGDLAGIRALKGLGAATAASPAPKVFSTVDGLETFSTEYFVEWSDQAGGTHSVPLTAEMYQRLDGPYNRRNVYGAALAYGPVLAEEWVRSILEYGFCQSGSLRELLDIEEETVAGPIRIRLEPKHREATASLQLHFEVVCP